MTSIWITENWFIPVDDKGYVEGPCFEGMLGCVVQLRSGAGDAELAMKIPRLLADTIEENAYICKMTEDEEVAVRKISTSGGNVEGLVSAQFFEANRLVKRRSTINSSYPEARAQHDHVIFVSFEREKPPRFCSVNFSGDQFSVFPAGCKDDFVSNVSKDHWEYFVGPSDQEQHLVFSRTVFRNRDLQPTAERGELQDALTGRRSEVWYAAIPSIIFQWAGGSLQETISKGEIEKWKFEEHFDLFEQVLRGVRFLHRHGMIHGDIRPANVMWIASPSSENYRLGDYGSYGKEWQAVGRSEAPGGLTLIGPAVGQRRQSPFYSPERRAGTEFESADTAVISRIIVDEKSGTYNYVILLGWRSPLLESGDVTQEVRLLMETWGRDAVANPPSDSTDQLQRGDRLKLRNYLFEVLVSEMKSANRKLFLCSGRYANILHDRLVVYKDSGLISDWTVIDLSNYVEFRQWSAASDLYSVGALFLYCLFCNGLKGTPVQTQTTDPDKLFVEMMEILESVPYFRFFWEELEDFRERIEELYRGDPQPSPLEAATMPIVGDQTLFDMALFASNNIIQSTPKARVVLEAFDYNLAHFLLFMHFVLACIHRKSHMSPETISRSTAAPTFMTPFACDRTEAPRDRGAANDALERLFVIRRYLDKPFFRAFQCSDDSKILDFDPRSDFQIRIEHENLRTDVIKLRELRLSGLLALHPEITRLMKKADKPVTEKKRKRKEEK